MYDKYIERLNELIKIQDWDIFLEKIEAINEELSNLVDDEFITAQHYATMDELDEILTLVQRKEAIEFLIDDVQNYLDTNFDNSKKIDLSEIKQISDDLRDSIYIDTDDQLDLIINDIMELEYDDKKVPSSFNERYNELLREVVKVDSIKELMKIIIKFNKESEEKYNFKMEPLYSPEVTEEIQGFLKGIKKIRKFDNALAIKNELIMADLPEDLEIDVEELYFNSIYEETNLGNIKKILTDLIEDVSLFYEIEMKVKDKDKKKDKEKNKANILVQEELLYFEDTEENKEINDILKVFHSISKPHGKGEYIGPKYKAILKTISENLPKEIFENLNIKYNPEIGLFIESKEGFKSEGQKLIMSHSDLVPSFEKLHTEILEGNRKSALTIGSDGFIRGSLDNTMPNAVVLNNLLKGRFEDNVSILFECDEETGMTGTSKFFKNKAEDKWVQVEFAMEEKKIRFKQLNPNKKIDNDIKELDKKIKDNNTTLESFLEIIGEKSDNLESVLKKHKDNKFIQKYIAIQEKLENDVLTLESNKIDENLIEDKIPTPQKDLVVINTDVTMGYTEPYAFETKNFSKETKDAIKSMFPNASVTTYGYDDSTSTVPDSLKALSMCHRVGSNYSAHDDKLSGGCHGLNTMAYASDIAQYSQDLSKFVNAINKELQISLQATTYSKGYSSGVSTYSKYDSIIDPKTNTIDSEADYWENYEKYNNINQGLDSYTDGMDEAEILTMQYDAVNDLVRELIAMSTGQEVISEFQVLEITDEEKINLIEELESYCSMIDKEKYMKLDTIEEFANNLVNDMDEDDFVALFEEIEEINGMGNDTDEGLDR